MTPAFVVWHQKYTSYDTYLYLYMHRLICRVYRGSNHRISHRINSRLGKFLVPILLTATDMCIIIYGTRGTVRNGVRTHCTISLFFISLLNLCLSVSFFFQGDKVRKVKASTKDKAVWQPEVNALLDLKKRLAALQIAK